MLYLRKISLPELHKLIEISYEGDEELFEKYHISPMGFKDCVDTTMAMIKKAATEYTMRYYRVIHNKVPVGFIAVYKNALFSFGVRMEYRNGKILSLLWDEIVRVLDKAFICRLYPNNTRAIGWLEKCGMSKMREGLDNCVSLIYNNKK